MSHLLYLMFRCDGDVMESLNFGVVFEGSKHTQSRLGGAGVQRLLGNFHTGESSRDAVLMSPRRIAVCMTDVEIKC